MRKAVCLLMLVAGCGGAVAPEAGRPVSSSIPPGIYRGDTDCDTTIRLGASPAEVTDGRPFRQILEILEDGSLLIDGNPVVVGQTKKLDLVGTTVSTTVTHVAATANGVIITCSIGPVSILVDVSGSYTATFDLVEGVDLMFEEVSSAFISDGITNITFRNECSGILSR